MVSLLPDKPTYLARYFEKMSPEYDIIELDHEEYLKCCIVSRETGDPQATVGCEYLDGGDDQVSTAPAFTSANQAVETLKSAMGYLAGIDATQLPTAEQAQILQGLEQVDAAEIAARASVLGGFTVNRGYCEDADDSPRTWLINQTRITKGAAAGHTGWARRAAAHPVIKQALAAMDISESFARVICWWTDKMPGDCRDQADAVLAGAACSGLDLPDIIALAAEMYERSRPADEDDPDRPFRDRSVRLETTFQRAGVLSGELTPECAAVVSAVLDALSAPMGAEDTRSHEERFHDGL